MGVGMSHQMSCHVPDPSNVLTKFSRQKYRGILLVKLHCIRSPLQDEKTYNPSEPKVLINTLGDKEAIEYLGSSGFRAEPCQMCSSVQLKFGRDSRPLGGDELCETSGYWTLSGMKHSLMNFMILFYRENDFSVA